MVLGPVRLPARPIYARALFSGRISMRELALRSPFAGFACCSRLRRGQRDRFLRPWQAGGPPGRARPGVPTPPDESVLRPRWGDGVGGPGAGRVIWTWDAPEHQKKTTQITQQQTTQEEEPRTASAITATARPQVHARRRPAPSSARRRATAASR